MDDAFGNADGYGELDEILLGETSEIRKFGQ